MKGIKPQFFILVLLVSFASVGAVLFTPALPSIATFFQVSVGKAQLAMTLYLVGYALGQLPYGPLANYYGRKKTLYIGICISVIGSLLCALSPHLMSFNLLLLGRFIQAIGACVGLKVSFTMIADSFEQVAATQMISKIIIVFAIMPGIAVAIGGWITHYLSWESCFYFLVLFSFLVLWLVTRLPETAKKLDRKALNFSSIIHGYGVKFKNPRIVLSGIMMGCGSTVVYIFASKAPFIGINLMGMTPETYGNYNFIPIIGMLLGAMLSAKLAGRFSVMGIVLYGSIASLVAAMTMFVPFLWGMLNPVTLFFPMFLIYLAEAMVYANVTSLGLAHSVNKSNGSAVLNFINLSMTVIAVLFAEFVHPESALLMPIGFLIFLSLLLILCYPLKKLSEST